MSAESGPQNKGMNRREFLRKSGTALAVWAMLPRQAIGWATEIKKESTFEQGILQLRNEVINNPLEIGAIWHVDKTGKGSWLSSREGEKLSVRMDDAAITSSIENGDIEIIRVHTHPLDAAANQDNLISKERLKQIRSSGFSGVLPSVPPSMLSPEGGGDLGNSLFVEMKFGSGIKIKNKVLDSQGVWEYFPDKDHPFVKEYIDAFVGCIRIFAELIRNEVTDKFLREIFSENTKASYADMLNILVERHGNEISPEQKKVITDVIRKWYSVFDSFAHKLDKLGEKSYDFYLNSVKTKNSADVLDLIQSYEAVGFKVSFTPYSEIK